MPFPFRFVHVCTINPYIGAPEHRWLAELWMILLLGIGAGTVRRGDYVYSTVDNHQAPDGFELHITNNRTETLLGKVVGSQLYQAV